jgi:hypothetical protein
MWLGAFGLLCLILAVIVGVLGGGVFTFILLALGILLMIPALLAVFRRPGAEGPGDTRAERRRVEQPLPHSRAPSLPDKPAATPDELVDARQRSI